MNTIPRVQLKLVQGARSGVTWTQGSVLIIKNSIGAITQIVSVEQQGKRFTVSGKPYYRLTVHLRPGEQLGVISSFQEEIDPIKVFDGEYFKTPLHHPWDVGGHQTVTHCLDNYDKNY